MKQIKGPFFYNFNPHIFIGKETFTTNYYASSTNVNSFSIDNSIFGLQIDNGFLILSPKKSGIMGGADLFFRTTNSGVLGADFGIKFNLGIAF